MLANNIYCWGPLQREYLDRFSSKQTKFIISGNTAYKTASYTKTKYSVPPKDFVLTIVSANYFDKTQYNVLDFLGRISLPKNWSIRVRAHPAEDFLNLAIESSKYNIQIFDNNQTVEECINQTDLFLVVDSNFVFDAINCGKPTVFYAAEKNHSDLPKLFEIHSNARMIQTEADLEGLLLRMINYEKIYEESNFESLRAFFKEYCSDFGESAARRIYNDVVAE